MVFPTSSDRFHGVTFGTAIGDALGYPVEFNKALQPVALPLPEGALVSDDTQMYLATLQGLIDAGIDADIDAAGVSVAARYVQWSISPENNRAPGNACMYGCGQLARRVPWREAGKPMAGGCGTAMRSMAYGQRFWGRQELAAQWAAEHALMTHRHSMAQAAAAAVASGVAMMAYEQVADQPITKHLIALTMISAAGAYDDATAEMLRVAVEKAADPQVPATEVLDQWRGWAGHEAVAASLFCFLRFDGFADAVLRAVNSPGDSDSLGAITGALAGGWYGVPGVDWASRAHVEGSEEMQKMAAVAFVSFAATR